MSPSPFPSSGAGNPPGPPPLRPFGLVLHHDGSWTHEGVPILNRRLRAAFDRAVRFLPGEGEGGAGAFVVQLGHFRGQIEVEEAPFFVRDVDVATGRISLSDRSEERLDVATLRASARDGALLCEVKRGLAPHRIDARFTHAAQAELLAAVEEGPEGPALRTGSALRTLPPL